LRAKSDIQRSPTEAINVAMEHKRTNGGKESQKIVEGCEIEDGFMWCVGKSSISSASTSLAPDNSLLRLDFVMSAIKDRAENSELT
jgi:hypothetical protein